MQVQTGGGRMKKPADMTLDEIYNELQQLQTNLTKPFMQVVTKTQKRRKGKKVYMYTYYYAQVRKNGRWHTYYLGKKIPPDVLEVLKMQNRYKELKRELNARLKRIRLKREV
jgi:hypothetical protein